MAEEQGTVYTWGYHGRSVDELLTLVVELGIALVVDVRRNAWSHRPEWRQSELRQRMRRYRHYACLGNHSGRRREWKPRDGAMASWRLERLAELVAEGYSVLLLCGERDPQQCHRSIVAERIQERTDSCEVVHL